MSDIPDIGGDAPDMLAAEYALGVLDDAGRAEVQQRRTREPAFDREVEAWEVRLAPLTLDAPAATPPAAVWGRIAAKLPQDAVMVLRRRLTLWRGVSAAASGLAAVFALALVWPRPPAPPPARPAPMMMADLQAASGGAKLFVAAMDPVRGELLILPAAIHATPGHSPELWLIPHGGKPISLGMVGVDAPMRLPLAHALGDTGRTTLAVSIEPLGGSPTGQPTGPVVATGDLRKL